MPASTVTEYLAALPAERRDALNEVRRGINRALPPGYKEGIQFGMISWFVPLSMYPAGYGGNPKQPLPLISLVSQKSYMALHMICFYGQPALLEWFKAQYGKSGKKLDMGHGCLRFKTLPVLALDVVERAVARLPVSEYAAGYQAMRDAMGNGKAKRKATPAAKTRPPAKKAERTGPAASARATGVTRRLEIGNVNVPGRKTRIKADKYEAMRRALLAVLPRRSPGLTQAEMFKAVSSHLPQDLFPGGATANWWAKTVQLDLEAKKILARENSKPLRWYRS
jgi:hypothetical protein